MKYILTFLLLIPFGFLFSQNPDDFYIKPDNTKFPTTNTNNQITQPQYDKRPFSENKKVQVQLSTGAGVMSFGGQTLFSTWVAPTVKYQLTPKFNLKVGAITMYGNMNNFQNYLYQENNTSKTDRLAQYYFFAQGEYKVNNKFTIRGTTMKEFSDQSLNPSPYSMNHIGFDYKISDKVTINADFLLSKGNTPWGMYSNPYNQNSFFSSASPFNGSLYRGW